jgi:hypothetical protein
MSRARLLVLSLVGMLASVLLVAAPAQGSTVAVHGVIRTALGTPVPFGWVGVLGQSGGVFADANGSYSLPVTPGPVPGLAAGGYFHGRNFYAQSSSFTVTEDRTEDIILPAEAVLRAHVREGDGTVSPYSEFVLGDLTATGSTSSGLRLDVRLDPAGCIADATGTCLVTGFRNGAAAWLEIHPTQRPVERLAGDVLSDAVNDRTYFLSPSVVASGTVRGPDGRPLAGAVVRLVGSASDSDATDDTGAWSIRSAPGDVSLEVNGSVDDGSRSGRFRLRSQPFSLQSSFAYDAVVPALAGLRAVVRDSIGNPVAGARVTTAGDGSVKRAITTGIPTVDATLNPAGTTPPVCVTGTDGSCELSVFRGGTTEQLSITPPGAPSQRVPAGATPDDPTEVGLRLAGYAIVQSAGTAAGDVRVTTSSASADLPSVSADPVDLPVGLQALVGRLQYRATLPAGGDTWIDVRMPTSATANAVLRRGTDGTLTDVSDSMTVAGNDVSFHVFDGGGGDADGVADGVVTGSLVPVFRSSLAVDTSALPPAAKGQPYQAQLAGSGPVPPYTWSPVDPLPPGLTLSPDGTLSGTPTTLGTWRFAVRMTESTGSRYAAFGTLTLNVVTMVVTTEVAPDAYVGDAYSFALQRAGGTGLPAWKVVGGSLPPGLKLGSGGTISGTPTAAGTYSFDVVVSSNGSTSPPQTVTMVSRTMEIATSSLPDAPVGASYSQTLKARGGAGTLAWSVGGGSLPPGLTLSPSGTISGRPTAVGTYEVSLRVTDASSPKQVATRTMAIVVTPMEVVTSTLADGKKGSWYSSQLVAEGGKPTLSWSLSSGALPAGLTLSAGGRIYGYPKTVGTWSFTVRVQDASSPRNEATRSLTLTIG